MRGLDADSLPHFATPCCVLRGFSHGDVGLDLGSCRLCRSFMPVISKRETPRKGFWSPGTGRVATLPWEAGHQMDRPAHVTVRSGETVFKWTEASGKRNERGEVRGANTTEPETSSSELYCLRSTGEEGDAHGMEPRVGSMVGSFWSPWVLTAVLSCPPSPHRRGCVWEGGKPYSGAAANLTAGDRREGPRANGLEGPPEPPGTQQAQDTCAEQ